MTKMKKWAVCLMGLLLTLLLAFSGCGGQTEPAVGGAEAVVGPQEVKVQGAGTSVCLSIPDTWDQKEVGVAEDSAVCIYPKAAPEGQIRVQVSREFGFCGDDDMRTEKVAVAGYSGTATYFDGASFWKFVVLDAPDAENCVLMTFVDEAWWSRYEGELTEILKTLTVEKPDSFALTWNVYGISSYDSQTGRLVKTTDATRPEDYVTEWFFSPAELSEILKEIAALDPESYPDAYDPYNAPDAEQRVVSAPDRTLILTYRTGGREKTVTCRNICLSGSAGYDAKATAFLALCDRLTEKITATSAWQALPDYEFLYD